MIGPCSECTLTTHKWKLQAGAAFSRTSEFIVVGKLFESSILQPVVETHSKRHVQLCATPGHSSYHVQDIMDPESQLWSAELNQRIVEAIPCLRGISVPKVGYVQLPALSILKEHCWGPAHGINKSCARPQLAEVTGWRALVDRRSCRNYL